MKIDLEHLHFWMCAIRESKDSARVLDSFWRGQLTSKVWLIDTLKSNTEFINIKNKKNHLKIDICGGWFGTLSSMLFQSNIPISLIRSIDIDPLCESTAELMNRKEQLEGRFLALTEDMSRLSYEADIIINTSCEHITQEKYDSWLDKCPIDSLIILQSNNYSIPEHIRIASNLNNFINQSYLKVLDALELDLTIYKRFMIIGKKCLNSKI